MKEYCDNCGEYVDYEVSMENQAFWIHGEKVEACIKIPRCKKCGEEIYVKSIEEENDKIIFGKYKKIKKQLVIRPLEQATELKTEAYIDNESGAINSLDIFKHIANTYGYKLVIKEYNFKNIMNLKKPKMKGDK